ncbi:MAG TPA: hypothetical protein DCY75_09885, partial [Clostridiales bacterium]|nr:hypothetical protein [Clostridiales bacterium]
MKIAILAKTAQRTNVFDDTYFDRMRKHGELSIFNQDDFNDRAYLLDVCRGANVIITTWGTPKLEKDILEVCPDLQCVIHAAGTPKPVITPELIDKKVRLTASNIAIGEGVAETALALMIGACKKFFWLCQDTANGMWAENKPKVKDFYDIKVGIVSGGMVGRHMVKLLKNFHVDILMYDPTLTKEEIAEIGAEKVGLDE